MTIFIEAPTLGQLWIGESSSVMNEVTRAPVEVVVIEGAPAIFFFFGGGFFLRVSWLVGTVSK